MSVLRPYRLERELDSAFYHWLAWLPHWAPGRNRRRSYVCAVCPAYVDALGLHEIPHGPLHGLFGAVNTLLAQQFDREVDAQFPRLRERDEWVVGVTGGVVWMATREGDSLDAVLEQEQHGLRCQAPVICIADEASTARTVLGRTYWELFEVVIARLGLQKTLILRAIDAHIEPKVRRLADELVAEVCAAI